MQIYYKKGLYSCQAKIMVGIPIFCVGAFISPWTVLAHWKNDILVVCYG